MKKAEHERMRQPPEHAHHLRMDPAPQQRRMHQAPQHAQQEMMNQVPQHIPRPTIDELYDQHDRAQEERLQRSAARSIQRRRERDELLGRPANPAVERTILRSAERIHATVRQQELIDFELHGQHVTRWREEARRNKED